MGEIYREGSLNIHNDETQLWLNLRKGDPNAITALYKAHYQILYSYGLKLSFDKELTKDCIQELFIHLWKNHQNLPEVKKIRPYLLQALWNKIIKELKIRQKFIMTADIEVYKQEVAFSFEHLLSENEEKEHQYQNLQKSLKTLTPRQKQILFMMFYENMSYEELQAATSLQYQSLKNIIYSALKTLRNAMKAKSPKNITF
ncbi:MAG: sigma-70 family RNA polymerase sigma factor [Cyclobacteriaceae bacterium]|nr:sigma-70 family RNA polymerase sigma factor [Cyclobacteriaceae bacterium]